MRHSGRHTDRDRHREVYIGSVASVALAVGSFAREVPVGDGAGHDHVGEVRVELHGPQQVHHVDDQQVCVRVNEGETHTKRQRERDREREREPEGVTFELRRAPVELRGAVGHGGPEGVAVVVGRVPHLAQARARRPRHLLELAHAEDVAAEGRHTVKQADTGDREDKGIQCFGDPVDVVSDAEREGDQGEQHHGRDLAHGLGGLAGHLDGQTARQRQRQFRRSHS